MNIRRVVIAPGSFKSCLSNVAVAHAIEMGLRDVWPEVAVDLRPIADGGDGTLAALGAVNGYEVVHSTTGPHGEGLSAAFWRSTDNGLAVVEMARASGLALTRHRDPLRATTAGTGALIRAAAAHRPRALWVGAGGSATIDGGTGALQALGFEFLDTSGQALRPGGGALIDLASIKPPSTSVLSGLTRVQVLADVNNTLIGRRGAARIYGPQKGADSAGIKQLEHGLDRLGQVLSATFGRDPRGLSGAGAAGGLAGGLWSALGAEIVPGFPKLAGYLKWMDALRGASLVITGEGQLDGQTGRGKSVAGLVGLARSAGVPVWAVVGRVTWSGALWARRRSVRVCRIDSGRFDEASVLIRQAVARAARRR